MSLSGALAARDVERVRQLLAEGIAPDSERTPLGQTPLSVASEAGQLEILTLLVAAGADLEAKDWSGLTPLMHAARAQQAAAVQSLLAAGADPLAADAQGRSADFHAAQRIVSFGFGRRGRHATVFLPRIIPTRTTRLLRAAMRSTTRG